MSFGIALSTVFTSASTTSSSTSLSKLREDIILWNPLLLSSIYLSREITFSIIENVRLFLSKMSERDLPAIFLFSGSLSDKRFRISASLSKSFLKGKRRAAEVSSKSLTQADLPVADFSIKISSTNGSKRYGFLFLNIFRNGCHVCAFLSFIHLSIVFSSIFDNSNVKKIKEESISVIWSEMEELYLVISGSSIFVANIKLLCVPIL